MNRRFALRSRLPAEYGLLLVLALLCGAFSVLTYREQPATGPAAAHALAAGLVRQFGPKAQVLIVAGNHPDDVAFADRLQTDLDAAGVTVYLADVAGGFSSPVTYPVGPDSTGLTAAYVVHEGAPAESAR